MQTAQAQAQAAVVSYLHSTEWDVNRRTAQLLASLCWHDRAGTVRSAVTPLLQRKRLPDAAALAAVSLLPLPPPPAHSRSPAPPPSPLSPILAALAEALVDPVRSRAAGQIVLNCLSSLLATFLFCKPGATQQGTGAVRTSAHHVFIAAATLTAATQWLKQLPQRAQQQPMLRLAWQLLEVLTVPRSVGREDSARALPGKGEHMPAQSARHLSQVTLFLQGVHCQANCRQSSI